jgi:hypothetical protein
VRLQGIECPGEKRDFGTRRKSRAFGMVFGWFAELEPATPECYPRPIPSVCFVMRNLNAERAGMDVHLSSPAPASVPSGYHKILEPVKGCNVTPPSWGSMHSHKSLKKKSRSHAATR